MGKMIKTNRVEKKIRQTKKGKKITKQINRGFEIASKWNVSPDSEPTTDKS